MTFKVGNKVIVARRGSLFWGEEGKIMGTDKDFRSLTSTIHPYLVEFSGRQRCQFAARELKLKEG